ncbi:MAG: PQQ-binding-like beta-propeller repeat protein, partial [Verrucomicrobiota bacterium]|nr:PQQ-binding-like beta-propeller repeat protein [Verrucomicrobiota bacterium]
MAGELGPMALAGQTLFAGGNGYTVSLDAATGRLISIYGVSGTVMSLAVADERLFVSTSLGEIHCLGVEDALPSIPRRMETAKPVALGQAERSIVEEIRRRSGLANGWCLVAGARDGRLALALARETQMNIVVIEHDPGRLEAIRNELYMSVLYGNRVIAADWGYNELPDYFANLIVSERAWLGDDVHLPMDHLARVLRPAGGVLLLGTTATWPEGRAGRVIDGLKANAKAAHEVSHADGWLKFTRGKLDGAGSWTGLYGNNSKTSSTADRLVKGPLGVLWFGEPGSEHMVDRHARSVSPLAINGRLFVQGMEVVMAYDAYNGTFLWQRKIPGAVRVRVDVDSSNITANDDSLFVAAHDRVLQLDAQTGKTRREFRVPRAPGGKALRWGNISIDGNTLFGTGAVPLANEYGYLWNALVKNGEWVAEADAPEKARARLKTVKASYPRPDDRAYDYFKRAGLHWYPINTFPDWLPDFKPSAVSDTIMLSEKVFAYDISTGELLWEHAGKSIPNISLVIGGDRVFFLQDDVNETERKEARDSVRASIEGGSYIPEGEQKLAEKDRDVRRVVSLDAKSGKVLWSRPYDLTGSGGTKLGLAYQDNKLLFFGHYSNHDEGPFNKG